MRVSLLTILLITLSILLWGYGDFILAPNFLAEISPLHHEFHEKFWFFSHLREGQFAWIDPHNDLGHPLLANPTNGLVSIFNLLYLFDSVVAAKIIFVFHYLLLVCGVFFLARHLAREDRVALVCASLVAACGLIWSLPLHVALASGAYFPWYLLALLKLSHSPSRRHAFVAGTLGAMVLTQGDPFLVPFGFGMAWMLSPASRKPSQYFFLALGFLLIAGANLWEMISLLPHSNRSAGFSAWEALSYSTHPTRMLEVLFPWLPHQAPIGTGFHNSVWFPRIGVGLVFSLLVIWGVRTKHQWRSLVLMLFFLQLSFGQFSPIASFLMGKVFWFIRFPERFLWYAFLASLPLLIAGAARLRARLGPPVLCLILLVSFAENLWPRPRPELVPTARLQSLQNESIAGVWAQGRWVQARTMSCPYGAQGEQSRPRYYDLRAFGVAMVNAESNTQSPTLKTIGCPWALRPRVRQWWGITNIITATPSSAVATELQAMGLKVVKREGETQWWTDPRNSPLQAQWISQWDREFPSRIELESPTRVKFAVQGDLPTSLPATQCSTTTIPIESSQSFQRFDIPIPKNCQGLLSIPWSFAPGWRVSFDNAQPSMAPLKIEGATLGIFVPSQTSRVIFSYDTTPRTLLFCLSLLTQFLLLLGLLTSFCRLNFFPKKI